MDTLIQKATLNPSTDNPRTGVRRTKEEKALISRPCRVGNQLFMNARSVARKKDMSLTTVRHRLVSPTWPKWRYLTWEESKKAFPHYKENVGRRRISLKNRLKMSKPFWGDGEIYLSIYDCVSKTGLTVCPIHRRIKESSFPDWRYATQEEIDRAVADGLFK